MPAGEHVSIKLKRWHSITSMFSRMQYFSQYKTQGSSPIIEQGKDLKCSGRERCESPNLTMTLSRFNLSSSQIPMESEGSSSAPTLTKRNSSSFPSPKNDLLLISSKKQSSSFPSSGGKISNFELISLKSAPFSSYTSLKDLMPLLSPQSPCSGVCIHSTFHDIPIKNRLVKQAAWAYLQPRLGTNGSNDRGNGFKRVWIRFARDFVKKPVDACLAFVARAFDRFLGAIRFRGTPRW